MPLKRNSLHPKAMQTSNLGKVLGRGGEVLLATAVGLVRASGSSAFSAPCAGINPTGHRAAQIR
jgi:hypothetical protein